MMMMSGTLKPVLDWPPRAAAKWLKSVSGKSSTKRSAKVDNAPLPFDSKAYNRPSSAAPETAAGDTDAAEGTLVPTPVTPP